MIKLNALYALLLAGITSVSFANSPSEELQPRDLDGDTSTIEAYYFPSQNLTWLADANIGLSETFGLQRSEFFSNFGSEINQEGRMLREGVTLFMQGMNDSRFLGHNQWRLPVADRNDPGCTVGFDPTFSAGENCIGPEVGEFNQFLNSTYGGISSSPFSIEGSLVSGHWLSSNGPSGGRHYFSFGGTGNLQFCGAGRCGGRYVWAVHDGDIGTPVSNNECIDTEPMNDGWGWNGVESCRVGSVVAADCIDSPPVGDGWGWDGVSSCVIESTTTCIDTPPANDGWGWDGSTSCRLDVVNPTCIDSPPTGDGWGWNGIESCRIIDPAIQTNCFDTAPEGDGWGWDGVASCRIF